MELNQVLDAIEGLVSLLHFIHSFVLISEINFDGPWLDLSDRIAVAQMAVETLTPRVELAVFIKCQRKGL